MPDTAILWSRNQFRSATAEPYVLSRSITREGTICSDSLARPFFFKRSAPTLAEVLKSLMYPPTALDRSARRKNALIVVTLEFLYCRPNCIFVYPPFDHKDICIDTMGYRKKRVNTFQNKSAD